MTTLQQAAYNILNQLRGGRSSNNEYLNVGQVKYWIKYYRALLIRRDYDRFSRIEELAQSIVIPMETSNEGWDARGQVFPETNVNSPLNTLKSVSTMPEFVRLKDKPAIMSVLMEDSLAQIPYIDIRRALWNQYDKYTSTVRRFWYNNGYLYVSNWDVAGDDTPTIILQAVFEDPEEAFNFDSPSPLWDDNVNAFPLSVDLLQQVTQSIISGEGRTIVSTVSDTTLDNLPDQQAE